MSLIRTLWKCTFSPRLFKVYKITLVGRLEEKSYEPKSLERWGDNIVICFAAMWSISLYTIPLVATFCYERGSSLADNVYLLSKLLFGAGAILIASLVARSCSRANNPVYLKFVQTVNEASARYNAETKEELHKYDFEFWAWPVDFNVTDVERDSAREKLTLEKIAASSGRLKRQTGKEFIFTLPCKLLAYIVAHTFAIKMIYPGSASITNWAFRDTLLKGRTDLIKQGGERYKLLTGDWNEIDVMFVDRRNRTKNANILVITCEGNCGFYESGIISTPLNKGYSVLGWNHPGFGSSTAHWLKRSDTYLLIFDIDPSYQGSSKSMSITCCPPFVSYSLRTYGTIPMRRIAVTRTPSVLQRWNFGNVAVNMNHASMLSIIEGAPFPLQEEYAIDCVMRFAIDHLRFPEEQIIIYGWSIGGYSATWAAMNYPSIQSLVLDATFDDILPLAMTTMPSFGGLVRNIIRDYFNLNIAEQLNRYNGSVLLIRRTEDEVVCTPSNTLSGNRGNMVLRKLLKRRYPHLFSDSLECDPVVPTFLSADVATRKSIIETIKLDEKRCSELIARNIEDNDNAISYPSTLGQDCDPIIKQQLILFLINVYMKDQSSSHCAPLAVDLFHPGWDPMSTMSKIA